MKTTKKRRFVLVYESMDDPPPAEVGRALDDLDGFEASEVLPGTIEITGDPVNVARAASHIDGWTLSIEGSLSNRNPSKPPTTSKKGE
ncbi:MAG TPA: hypothetical protein VGN75_09640 [Kaistia sp.]|jgi:hypothetical protein|nr:hypothetical protein [Kaistia sp.]